MVYQHVNFPVWDQSRNFFQNDDISHVNGEIPYFF